MIRLIKLKTTNLSINQKFKDHNQLLENSIIKKVSNISFDDYKSLLKRKGLAKTWEEIINLISKLKISDLKGTLFEFDRISNLYEFGLAYTNKISKKDTGKYYTPKDVSFLMSKLLLENNIKELVDVASGTGNLVIETLILMQKKNININQFIKHKRLWIYDLDKVALMICVAKIEILCQEKIGNYINIIKDDFLNKNIQLPMNSSVICNPPYKVIKSFKKSWQLTSTFKECKDLYGGFIDKILDYCQNAVIISPQSFLVAKKFSFLRAKMNKFSGEIFSFDNVPSTVFNGKKYGIFNSNSASSIRASITSLKRKRKIIRWFYLLIKHKFNIKKIKKLKFRITHLVRFKSTQRKKVINLKFLRSKLSTEQNLESPLKMFKNLENFMQKIIKKSNTQISNILETNPKKQNKKYKIYISTSARYFVVGTKRKLSRSGYFSLYAKDYKAYILLYSFLNSSYLYMWWRSFDGGILLNKNIVLKTPIIEDFEKDLLKLTKQVSKMIKSESRYLSYKKNSGKSQETVKFAKKYRDELNNLIFPFKYVRFTNLLHKNMEE